MSEFAAREQYFLELVNRARLDPLNEAARLLADPAVIDAVDKTKDGPNPLDLEFAPGADGLNRGLPAGTVSGLPLQPLAPNALLRDAAEGHSDWMLDANTFSHTGENGSTVPQRIAAAGYVVVAPGGTGENLSWRGTTGSMDMDAATLLHHAGLFASDGHRRNTLTDWFRETGVAQLRGEYTRSDGSIWDSSMLTQKFAASGSGVFLTGVAYTDADADGFYSIGEGQAGVTIAAAGTTTLSAPAGGYALGLVAAPDVAVSLTWGDVDIGAVVDLTGGNVKLDLVAGTGGVLRLLSSADMVLAEGAAEGALLGAADLSLSGNDAGNLLIGNRGANTLQGGLGDDTLTGGAGDDTLDGGGGINTARFSGNFADYLITSDGAATLVADQRGPGTALAPHDGTDRLSNIRFLDFADGVHDLAPPPTGSVILSGQVELRTPGGGSMAAGTALRFTPEGGGPAREATTDAAGAFSFDIPAGMPGSLALIHDYVAGVHKEPAIMDVLGLFRMIVGVTSPSSPADLLAADYDGNGAANIVDVLALFRHIVGVDGAVPPRFVIFADEDMPDGNSLSGLPVPGPVAMAALDQDTTMEFTAILTGDLHGYS